MKNIDKELRKMSDKQHYIHDDINKTMESVDDTTDKIIEVLKRMEEKLEKMNARLGNE